MGKLIGLIALLVLLAVPASAQTVEVAIDRVASVGVEIPVPYDLDGDPTTREWVQQRHTAAGLEIRGLSIRGEFLCSAPWFDPLAAARVYAVPGDTLVSGAVMAASGGRDMFIVWGTRGYYEIAIRHDECPPPKPGKP